VTQDELIELFEKNDDEYLKFEKIENPLHKRPDLCAFLRLDQLVPGTHDMVSAAEHDEIYLEVDLEKLAEVATADDVIYLQRCGIRLDDYNGGLAMFV
jgi:hypothetical protein